MREHVLHHRLHHLQVGEGGLHLVVHIDAIRIDGEILEVFDRLGVSKVATEEHMIMVLDGH